MRCSEYVASDDDYGTMWRAFFMAVGVSLCILGAECLVVDEAVLGRPSAAAISSDLGYNSAFAWDDQLSNLASDGAGRVIRPPEWAPWSLLAAGAVVLLYSLVAGHRSPA